MKKQKTPPEMVGFSLMTNHQICFLFNSILMETGMVTNPPSGDGHRNGAVRDRSQTYNPQNNRWVKRDDSTGRL
jgi:hypothetical protein